MMVDDDDERQERIGSSQATGRVRIIGATEAGKAAGASAKSDAPDEGAGPTDAQDAKRDGDLGESIPGDLGDESDLWPPATEGPEASSVGGSLRNAGSVDRGREEQEDQQGVEPASVEMPHWTEPPTGEVPSVLMRGDDDDPGTWPGTPAAPVWKGEHTDWADDDVGYEHSQLADEGIRLGAMVERGSAAFDDRAFTDQGEDDYGAGDHPDSGLGEESGREPEIQGLQVGFESMDPSATTVTAALPDSFSEPYRHVRIRSAAAENEDLGIDDLDATDVGSGLDLDEKRRTNAESRDGMRGRRRRSQRTRTDPSAVLEPGSVGTPGGGSGRNMWVAIGTGLFVGAVTLAMFKEGSVTSLALCVVLVTVAASEFFGALRKAGYAPATLLGLAGSIFVMIAAYLKGGSGIVLSLALVVVFAMLWYLAGIVKQRPVVNIGVTLLGFAWVGFLGSFAGLLLDPRVFPHRHGVAIVLGAGIATVAHDIGGLLAGQAFGRRAHQLAPRVSPHKTWEGLAGASVMALIVCLAIVRVMSPWTTSSALGLAVVVVILAPLGDLCESLVKRDLGLKDMGSLLPGHGGMFDRVDAMLFVLPAVYYMARLAHIG
ncbi:MAG: phosphatidate cytidylyltransferase [Actinomycetota bacterium]|jgi:phosphatidate cytidylyltransferase|nr:phosphatidate cytidylyltransferase [Actinomycetota bacterium]